MRAGPISLAVMAMVIGAAAPPRSGEIAVTATGLRVTKGTVLACMTARPETFPDCDKDPASYRATAAAAEGKIELRFADVKPGRYSIALLHDENDNGKADRVLGIAPREGFGFSRDAKVKMGPPSFNDAAFDYDGDGASLTIRMRYLF